MKCPLQIISNNAESKAQKIAQHKKRITCSSLFTNVVTTTITHITVNILLIKIYWLLVCLLSQVICFVNCCSHSILNNNPQLSSCFETFTNPHTQPHIFKSPCFWISLNCKRMKQFVFCVCCFFFAILIFGEIISNHETIPTTLPTTNTELNN